MNLLYDKKMNRTDTYKYTINQGGELNIRVSNGSDRHITIVFVNGKFKEVEHYLGDFNTRDNWYIFESIAKEIADLEDEYSNKLAVANKND